ncbi:unnamed protein product [Durusdinium trenchii]|uniref:Uncharacterized protein n=1 Tax=Durusdinium trenchii TaxID=1381693 RepID=A0ABP0LV65_9DINO
MTQKDAIESLDPTGLMRQVGIPSDHAGESVSADRMEDGRVAALPSVIGNQVERLVCRHRRDRKMIVDKMPTDWEKKLSTINSQTMSICWNRKTCSMATPWYVKKVTRMVHGKLEFVPGSGKGYELIYLRFTPSDEKDPAGRGTYWLSSANYEARPVCCMNSTADRSGFDLLKEAYAGDSDASVEDEDDAVNPEEEEEEGTSGMQAPEDVVAHDHEDATPGESESDGSAPSSGMEDADLESDESGEEEEVQGYEGENGETKEPIVVGALGPKHKAYHTSPEWLQLLEFEKEKKVILSKIPNVIGAGVHRHPSKCFWTAIYPACSIKSCSWGASRTPLECLIKCIKHIIKQHLIAYPNSSEDSEWKSQLQSLSDLISSS